MPDSSIPKASLLNAMEEMSVAELTTLIQMAEDKRREKLLVAKQRLVEEFQAKASELGLSAEALMSEMKVAKRTPKPTPAEVKIPAKFRGPNGEEWSGRGRIPKWLSTLESNGRNRNDFAV